jgi:DNA topoisomerase VI subunit A
MATALEDRNLNKLLDVMCDVRVDKRELSKMLSVSTQAEQEAVFQFILEYIRWYAFQCDMNSFVNDNMEIAVTCRNLRDTLD